MTKNLNLVKLFFHFNFRLPFIFHKLYKLEGQDFYDYFLAKINEIFKVLRVNFKLEGIENLHLISDNYFIVSNHRSMIDPLILTKILGKNKHISYIMKSSLSKIFFINKIGEKTNSKYLERNAKEDLKTILEIIELQKNNNNFLIFPEGTRNKTELNVLDFRAASFKIPLRAKSDIAYFALYNSESIFEKKSKGKNINVYLKIFEPLKYDDYKSLKTTEISNLIQSNINSFIEKIKVDFY